MLCTLCTPDLPSCKNVAYVCDIELTLKEKTTPTVSSGFSLPSPEHLTQDTLRSNEQMALVLSQLVVEKLAGMGCVLGCLKRTVTVEGKR